MNPDDVQASEEVGDEEAIPAKAHPSPTQPTRKEIQEHVLTHLPPRSWCRHCLRGSGTSLPHFRSKTEGEHVVPTVSIDYFFMGPSGQEEAQGVLPMLAVKSHESRMTFARVVERKGPVDSTCCRSRLVGIAKIGVQIRSRTGDSGSQAGGLRVDAHS